MNHNRSTSSILFDIILTLVTFGIWNLWVQIRQIGTVNDLAGKNLFFHPVLVLILSILTLGVYFWWHEFRMTRELHRLEAGETYYYIEIPIAFLTFLGLWFVVDSYQQHLINKIISKGQ